MKCKCHPESPFHWKHNTRPSMFIKDSYFKGLNAAQSKSQTEVVERKRIEGNDVATISNLSNRTKELKTISLRQITVYSKAGKFV